MDSGTILIIKQELVDKDLPTLSLNNLNSKIILKEKLLTVSLIPPHQQDIMKKRHYWRLDSKSITMFKVKKMLKVNDKTLTFSKYAVGNFHISRWAP